LQGCIVNLFIFQGCRSLFCHIDIDPELSFLIMVFW